MAKKLIQDIIPGKKQPLPTPVPPLKPQKEPARPHLEDMWDKAIKDTKEKGKNKVESRRFKIPFLKFSNPRFKLALGIFVLAVLVIGGLVLLNDFSSVVVEITPKQQLAEVDAVFTASTEPQNNELPLEVMQLSYAEEGTATATGKKQVSQKASGQIVIYNAYNSQPHNLITNTRFQAPDGKIYRISKPVVIPGAKIENGKIIPSEIEITVYADKPGEEYNIGLTDFTIPGFSDAAKRERIYGRSKTEMKGGFVGEATVIETKDIADLNSSLEQKVQDYLLKMAINPKPEEFLLYDSARQIIFEKAEDTPKAGEMADSLELKKSATLFGFLLKKTDISQALAKKYLGEAASEADIVDAATLVFELKNFTAKSITFNLKGQAGFAWKIDETGLKNDLVNEKGEPESVFQKYSVIEQAKIIFKPSWWRSMPASLSQIDIKTILK